MLVDLTHQFLVQDLQQAIRFYEDKLGFRTEFTYSDFYAGVERDGIRFHLKLTDEPDPSREFKLKGVHLDGYVSVDDVDSLFREYQERDTPFLLSLHNTDWGTREFAVKDPDGYILYFGCMV